MSTSMLLTEDIKYLDEASECHFASNMSTACVCFVRGRRGGDKDSAERELYQVSGPNESSVLKAFQ